MGEEKKEKEKENKSEGYEESSSCRFKCRKA